MMQDQDAAEFPTPRQRMRSVVIIVVAAKLAVFALLMATVNLPAPISTGQPGGLEISALR